MQDSNAGGICKGPWAARGAYRAVEDHEALVEVVVLQRGVAVQLGQRVLASDGAGRGGGGRGRGESHRLHHVPVYPFLWLTKKEAYFTKFIRPTIFSPFAEKAVSNLWGGSRKSQVGHCNCCRLRV